MNSDDSTERGAVRSFHSMIMMVIIALAFLTILSVTAASSSTDDMTWDISATENDSVTASYVSSSNTLTITGTGAMKDWTGSVSAPWIESYKGEIVGVTIGDNVTNVGNYAFDQCSKVAAVTLGKDIKKIGQYAFRLTALTSVTIPDSVETIDTYAFQKCASLKTVNIGSGLKTIEQQAFNSSGITSLTVPGNVETINGNAFSGCASLATLNLGNGIKTIGTSAFTSTGITSVTIPNTVETLGVNAFKECTSLTTVKIGGSLLKIGDSAFNGCTKLASVSISDSVTAIGKSSFYGCSKLATVEFGVNSGLQEIGKQAFFSCGSLVSIALPDSVKTIGEEAFAQSSKLATVTIGANSSLQTIGVAAFKLTALTSFFIPKDVSTIGERFVVGAPITAYTVDSDNQNFCSDDKGVLFNKDKTELVAYPAKGNVSYDIPDTVITVRTYAFYQSLVQAVSFGKVVTIGAFAFNECIALTSVSIPDTVTTIGSRAFGSDLLDTVTVYTSGTEKSFANDAFDLIFRIGGIEVDVSSAAFPGHVYIMNHYTDTMDDSGVARTWYIGAIEDGNVIADYNGYTKTLMISGTGAMMDWSNTSKAPWDTYKGAIVAIVIDDGVTNIGDFAFCGCSVIASVAIPNGVKSIGESAFSSCTALKEVTIPNGVTSIGKSAFSSCTALKEVTFPNGVTSIGESAFSSCTALKEVVIPNSVTSIGKSAFSSCTALKEVVIPNGVTSIGESAFSSCTALGKVIVKNTAVPTLGKNAFGGCSATLVIFAPSGSVPAYRNAENWSSYAGIIFADFASCTVDDIADQIYTGSQITPVVTVRDGARILVLNIDYTVEYGYNVDLGEGTVTVKGAGIYNGIIEKTFTIVKGAPASDSTNYGIIIGIAIAAIVIMGLMVCFMYTRKQ